MIDRSLVQISLIMKIFKEKAPGRNNHNASKLIEKYNNLAREASYQMVIRYYQKTTFSTQIILPEY